MKPLNPVEREFWEKYLATLPQAERPPNPSVYASHAGNEKITDELLQLYFDGKKYAGSGLVEDYQTAGDPLPKAGDYWIILNSRNVPSCIVQTERTVLNKWLDVPEEIARAEGEGDLSLSYWRKAHGDFFQPFLASWGLERLEDATVITEFFKIVWR